MVVWWCVGRVLGCAVWAVVSSLDATSPEKPGQMAFSRAREHEAGKRGAMSRAPPPNFNKPISEGGGGGVTGAFVSLTAGTFYVGFVHPDCRGLGRQFALSCAVLKIKMISFRAKLFEHLSLVSRHRLYLATARKQFV